MVLQLVMDMAGTFPILGYLLIKKIFKKHMTAQKYIWILRLSIILYLCPFQEFKYLILPEKLLERFNFADFWGIAGKKISGFEVVNIPSLFGDYYVTPRGIFLVTVIWFIICTILVIYYYGTYFFIKTVGWVYYMLNIDDFRVLPQIPSTLILIHRNPATARSH